MIIWFFEYQKAAFSYYQGWENGQIAFVEPIPYWGPHRLANLNCNCKWLYVFFVNLLYWHGKIPATTPGMSLSSIISRPLRSWHLGSIQLKPLQPLDFLQVSLHSLRLDRFLVVSNPDLSFTSRNMSKKLIFYTFCIFAQLTSVVDTHCAFSSAFIIRISLTSCIASFIRDPCCEWR